MPGILVRSQCADGCQIVELPRPEFVQAFDVMVRAGQALDAVGADPQGLSTVKVLMAALPGAVPGLDGAAGLMGSACRALAAHQGLAEARHVVHDPAQRE
jgi:hypothetical protein